MWSLLRVLFCMLIAVVSTYGYYSLVYRKVNTRGHVHLVKTLNYGMMAISRGNYQSTSRTNSFEFHSKLSQVRALKTTSLKASKSSERPAVSELLRTQNVIPTLLLNTLGGLMQRKGWRHLISTDMMKANLISVFIAFASCVVNDIVDIDVDKLNSPNNPLASGRTSVPMAYLLTFLFFTLPYWISRSMNPAVSFLTESSIILLLLYTPVLKKIMVIKNLTCSFVIANTILLAATCFLTNTQQIFDTLTSFDMFGRWLTIFNLCTMSATMYAGAEICALCLCQCVPDPRSARCVCASACRNRNLPLCL